MSEPPEKQAEALFWQIVVTFFLAMVAWAFAGVIAGVIVGVIAGYVIRMIWSEELKAVTTNLKGFTPINDFLDWIFKMF
ncbi:MAG: hypothetical protein V5A63_19535 [Bacteroides sp.]|uniref:hypothetical protein n=1 Tax=Bacteroides sp. TaxID=29523 RepID=UPI002FC3C29A